MKLVSEVLKHNFYETLRNQLKQVEWESCEQHRDHKVADAGANRGNHHGCGWMQV